jgi:hypothetical protein
MNRISTLAAIALSFAAAGSAFADDITIDNAQHVSTLTRAQVDAERVAFQKAGPAPWSIRYNQFAAPSKASRSDVKAELAAARASGELQGMFGEDSGSAYLAAHTPVRSASHVVTAQR